MSLTQDTEDRCQLSDLPAYSCSHCRGHREEKPLKLGELYKTVNGSHCAVCDHNILSGERLATNGEGGHVCEDCHKDLIASDPELDR